MSNFRETNNTEFIQRREKQKQVVVIETKGVTIAH